MLLFELYFVLLISIYLKIAINSGFYGFTCYPYWRELNFQGSTDYPYLMTNGIYNVKKEYDIRLYCFWIRQGTDFKIISIS
jgi:hypothetical protein